MDYEHAERLARTWLELTVPAGTQFAPDLTLTRPYRWVFRFRSRLTGGPRAILVDRIHGELRLLGGPVLEVDLAVYEATLPPARLSMAPEFPPHGNNDEGDLSAIDAAAPIVVEELPPTARSLYQRLTSVPRSREADA